MNKGDCLRYGQIVSISPLEYQQLNLFSDGFIKIEADLVETSEAIIASGTKFIQCLFKIYPAFITSRLTQAIQLQEELRRPKYDDESKRVERIQEAQQKVIVEYKMNIETAQKVNGVPLSFNNGIQFLHIATNKFLTCNYNEAEREKENFKLELMEYPSARSCFRLLPAFQHQFGQEAQIYAGDSMYIVMDQHYMGNQPMLHVAGREYTTDTKKFLTNRILFPMPNVEIFDRLATPQFSTKVDEAEGKKPERISSVPGRKKGMLDTGPHQKRGRSLGGHNIAVKREANVSLEKCSPWIINIYSNENEDENVICFGDLIWIHHIEENSIICMLNNEKDELIISYQTLGMQVEEFEGNSNGMWQLEGENMKIGGKLEWDTPVRMRHLSIGKYLAIDDKPFNNKGQKILYLSDLPGANTLFQMVPLPSSDSSSKYITKDAFFKLKTSGTQKHQWIHFEAVKQMHNLSTNQLVIEEDIPILVCRLSDYSEDEDVLKLYKANYSEEMEATFLITSFPVLRKGLAFFKRLSQEQNPDEKTRDQFSSVVKRVCRVLQELDRFCNNQMINTQLDRIKAANPARQRVLREQYFIEVMIETMRVITTEDELRRYDEHIRKLHEQHLRQLAGLKPNHQHNENNNSEKREHTENDQENDDNVVHASSMHPTSQAPQVDSSTMAKSSHVQTVKRASQQQATKMFKAGVHVTQNAHILQHQSEHHMFQILKMKTSVLKLIYKLLTSICEENEANQYYVYKRFPQFLYQARYFREATDCIIKVIGGNEQILSNLCDQIKLNEKKKEAKGGLNQSESSIDEFLNEDELEFNDLVLDQVNQNVLLYYKTITEQAKEQRNNQFIQFFRALCRYKGQGITVNQEMIFKFIKQNDVFKNALFMPIIVETTKMKIQVGAKNIIYLTSVKDPEVYSYLVNQLYLYADLSSSRNFLWKSYLERIFPTQFVFNQVFDNSMNIDYRSAFCNMAISIYVDHEPFSKVITPALCRLVLPPDLDKKNSKFKRPKMNAARKQRFQRMMEHLSYLVDNTSGFVKRTCELIEEELIRQSNLKRQQLIQKQDNGPTANLLTNQLVFDIIHLVDVLIQYDILTLMKKQDKQLELFPCLIKILEFDRNNMLFSYILQIIRKNKIAKAEESQNKLIALKSSIGSAVQNLTDVGKRLTTSILGIPKKQQDSLEVEFSEYDTTVISRNPIIGSLVTIQSEIEQLNITSNRNIKYFDLEIKTKICEILNFFQDQRQDFYIENFLRYYRDKGTKFKALMKDPDLKGKLQAEIKDELVLVLPPLMRSGLESLDNEIKEASHQLWQPNKGTDVLAMGALLKATKKFTNYLEREVPDLDTLLSGTMASIMKSELLPSLLITFYMTSDIGLQDKLLTVMRRSFGQKRELFDYLQRIEILFDENDIQCFYYLEHSLKNFQQLSECSEVWTVDFLAEPQGPDKEVQKLLRLVSDIHSFLFEDTHMDEHGRIITSQSSRLSQSRQKIFYYLEIHLPILNFIRDTQNQLAKVSKDPFYSAQTKNLSLQILRSMYNLLADFCRSNETNQNDMFPHIALFLDEIELEISQIELVCAIFQDNKQLCERISDPLQQKVLAFLKHYGRQQRFLKLFIVMQGYKQQPLLENQIKVRKLFIPQRVGTEDYVDMSEFRLFGDFRSGHDHEYIVFDFQVKSSRLLDQPYLYHVELFDLLLETVKGEEGFKLNVPHLKRIFNLHYFLELLMQEDDLENQRKIKHTTGISLMKPKLVQLVTQIYINNSVIDLFLFIKEQPTFAKLFTQERNRLPNLQVGSAYSQYFFDDMIVLMKYYCEKLIPKDGNAEFLERDDYQQLLAIVNIILKISSTSLFNSLNALQYNNLVKFVYSVDDQLFKANAGQFSQCLEQVQIHTPPLQSEEPEIEIKKVQSIFTSKAQLDSVPLIKPKLDIKTRLQHAEKKIFAVQGMAKATEQAQWFSQSNFKNFIQLCNENTNFHNEVKLEMRVLSESVQRIDSFLPEAIVKELSLQVQFKDILRKLIRFVELGIINKVEKMNLIFTLQMLSEMLDSAPNQEEKQNLFDQCGSTKMYLNLLANFQTYPFDDDLLLELLKFQGIAAKGGNVRVQQTIYNYLANFEKSEMVFFKWNSIIYEVIEDQKHLQRAKQQKEVKEQKAQFQNLYLQQNEQPQLTKGVDDQHQKELQGFRKMKQAILIQLLKLFQLMCEGHYLAVQNYLRQQTNSRNNYNIVQAMVELLCVFQDDLQTDGFDVIMNTLETLTELVQGPCSKNQQDIIDSKFLDVASFLLGMHIRKRKNDKSATTASERSDERNIKERSNSNISGSKSNYGRKKLTDAPIERWMLERLKYKCMVLVTSLLELNSDDMAIKRIMRSMPIEVLKENLITVYKKYRKMYGEEYTSDVVGHIYADPYEKTLDPGYHELIIETGFFIYFLICYYADLSSNDFDQETKDELQIIKDDQKGQAKDDLAELRNSIIGQLISLAYALIKGILSTLNGIRTYLHSHVKMALSSKAEEQIDPEKKALMKKIAEQKVFQESVKFFAKNSASIEVLRNGNLERIVFYKLSYCNYLPKESKIEFHENVDRDSVNSKISDLMDKANSLIEVCKHEETLTRFFNKYTFVAIFANYVILWKDLAYLMTLTLNVLIIMSFFSGDTGSDDHMYHERIWGPRFLKYVLSTEQTDLMFHACGYVMIICSTFVVGFFLMKKGPLYAREAWDRNKELLKKDQACIVRFAIKGYMVLNSLIMVLTNIEVMYYLAYGVLAFIATLFHPFFFAFHMSEVVLRYPTMRNVIRSFWEPKTALFLTMMLIMVTNYYFSIFSYVYLYDLYVSNKGSKCDSLIVCFLSTFDYAFKNNGGIGGWFDGNAPQTTENYSYTIFLYDNLNNMVIQIIMINIFSGIIIDRFGSLREKQLTKDNDTKDVCFICGMPCDLFDRRSDYGFPQHTRNEHYMWNYVFYLAYLGDKNKNERNGIETYITEKMKNQDNSWFPIGQALGLLGEEFDSKRFQTEEIMKLQTGLSNIRTGAFQLMETANDIEYLKQE